MSKKPYTRKELNALAQSIHDRECEDGIGVYLSIVDDRPGSDCTAMCVGLNTNGLANVIDQILGEVGPLPLMAVMAQRVSAARTADKADPLDAEVLT